jgi:hypothetical protein
MVEQHPGRFIPPSNGRPRAAPGAPHDAGPLREPAGWLAAQSSIHAVCYALTMLARPSSLSRRAAIVAFCTCLAGLLLPASALAWNNGGDGGNGFGTHDWVIREAARLAKKQGAGWLLVRVAELKSDDPDTRLRDFYYHVYDIWGDKYGDAPSRVRKYYRRALAARKAGDWRTASKNAGLMAHYYADICNPLHTDQTDAEDRMHSSYESAAQRYTDEPGENSAWVVFDGYDRRSSVASFTRSTAKASHKSYSALVRGYNRDGMSPEVLAITKRSMNRAANGLADLLIGIKRRVPGV